MRIVFFGASEFSLSVLKGLIDIGQEVVGVVSQPDKVNGRGGKVSFSPVKTFCVQKNIPLFQFEKLNIQGELPLSALNADLFVTASYGQIIKQNILDIPKYGTINVHASLLPKYRGAAPIQWAILNGEAKTGVTIMKTDIGLDTGDIYFSKEIDILDSDTSSSMFNKLAALGVDCLREFFTKFDYYQTHRTKQDDSKSTYARMLTKEDYLLDFNKTATQVFNKIRALEGCYFMHNGLRYKVFDASVVYGNGTPGELLVADSKNGLVIACETGAVKISTIQPEGKGKMPASAFMNAKKLTKGEVIKN